MYAVVGAVQHNLGRESLSCQCPVTTTALQMRVQAACMGIRVRNLDIIDFGIGHLDDRGLLYVGIESATVIVAFSRRLTWLLWLFKEIISHLGGSTRTTHFKLIGPATAFPCP